MPVTARNRGGWYLYTPEENQMLEGREWLPQLFTKGRRKPYKLDRITPAARRAKHKAERQNRKRNRAR